MSQILWFVWQLLGFNQNYFVDKYSNYFSVGAKNHHYFFCIPDPVIRILCFVVVKLPLNKINISVLRGWVPYMGDRRECLCGWALNWTYTHFSARYRNDLRDDIDFFLEFRFLAMKIWIDLFFIFYFFVLDTFSHMYILNQRRVVTVFEELVLKYNPNQLKINSFKSYVKTKYK